jgi:hypothetical protein
MKTYNIEVMFKAMILTLLDIQKVMGNILHICRHSFCHLFQGASVILYVFYRICKTIIAVLIGLSNDIIFGEVNV